MKKTIWIILAVIVVAAAAAAAVLLRKEPEKVTTSKAKFVWRPEETEDILLQQGKCEDEICMQFKEDESVGHQKEISAER